MCVCEAIGAPSIFKVIRKVDSLARILTTFDLSCEENRHRGSGTGHGRIAQAELLNLQKSGQFPDEPVRIKV